MYTIYLLIACIIGSAVLEVFIGSEGIKSFFIGALGGLGFGIITLSVIAFAYSLIKIIEVY